MQKYVYLGINQQDQRVKGQLIAVNQPDAERQVAQMGIELLSLSERKDRFAFMQRKRVSNKDIITMTFRAVVAFWCALIGYFERHAGFFSSGLFPRFVGRTLRCHAEWRHLRPRLGTLS